MHFLGNCSTLSFGDTSRTVRAWALPVFYLRRRCARRSVSQSRVDGATDWRQRRHRRCDGGLLRLFPQSRVLAGVFIIFITTSSNPGDLFSGVGFPMRSSQVSGSLVETVEGGIAFLRARRRFLCGASRERRAFFAPKRAVTTGPLRLASLGLSPTSQPPSLNPKALWVGSCGVSFLTWLMARALRYRSSPARILAYSQRAGRSLRIRAPRAPLEQGLRCRVQRSSSVSGAPGGGFQLGAARASHPGRLRRPRGRRPRRCRRSSAFGGDLPARWYGAHAALAKANASSSNPLFLSGPLHRLETPC